MNLPESVLQNIEDFVCEICHKQFSKKFNVKRHMLIHNGVKPYSCNICNAAFTQNGSLLRHIRIHAEFDNIPISIKRKENELYLCMICGKSFKTSSGLSIHLKRHEGEKKFGCTVCKIRSVHSF